MSRGPLPIGTSPPNGANGVLWWLNFAYGRLPPIARLALAQHVGAWAQKAEQDARTEIERAGWNQGRSTYDTTCQTRP